MVFKQWANESYMKECGNLSVMPICNQIYKSDL